MQTQSILDQIRQRLSGIAGSYNRLVLVVGPSGSGKTESLRALSDVQNVPIVNIGLEISRQLLDLTERQQVLHLPRIVAQEVVDHPCDLTILDNTEVLFNPILKQDPLRLLQGLSRDRIIVTSWAGDIDGGLLTFAVPGHPEFRQYSSTDLLVVSLKAGQV